jgi:hypothetical protein
VILEDTLRYELPVEGNSLLGYIVRRMHKTEWLTPIRQLLARGDTQQALAHIAAYALSASTSFGRAYYQPSFDEPGTQISAADPATGAVVTARLLSTKPHYRIAYDVKMPDGAVFDGIESITGTTIGLRGLGMPAPSQFAFHCGEYESKLRGLVTSELVLSLFGNTRIRAFGKLEFEDNAGNSGSIEVERSGRARLLVNGKDVVLEGAAGPGGLGSHDPARS